MAHSEAFLAAPSGRAPLSSCLASALVAASKRAGLLGESASSARQAATKGTGSCRRAGRQRCATDGHGRMDSAEKRAPALHAADGAVPTTRATPHEPQQCGGERRRAGEQPSAGPWGAAHRTRLATERLGARERAGSRSCVRAPLLGCSGAWLPAAVCGTPGATPANGSKGWAGGRRKRERTGRVGGAGRAADPAHMRSVEREGQRRISACVLIGGQHGLEVGEDGLEAGETEGAGSANCSAVELYDG